MEAYIITTASYFPNSPVSNDEMESYLGMIDGHPSRARRIVLARNGIKNRYYALDHEGRPTHTNVELAVNSIKRLIDKGINLEEVDLLSCGTASPEQIMPSHGVQVHGKLRAAPEMEVVSFAGSCCTGMDALKYAKMAIETGDAHNAIVTASERLSAWMRACYFQAETDKFKQIEGNPYLSFDKEFLRWMLSDGAVSMLVTGHPAADGLSLRIEWIEKTSYASSRQVCMYAGGALSDDGELVGWSMFPSSEWLTRSMFSLRQDTKMLGSHIVELGGQFLQKLIKKYRLKPDDIDWFMPHLSSMFFKDKILETLSAIGFEIPEERWFLNLPQVGNIASASAFAMIDGLLSSGKLKRGQKVMLMVPESARFSYTFCLLTAV